jgi:hypothetical protein
MQLTKEEEHQDGILMIGGIEVFLPFAQEEVDFFFVEEQSQLEMTFKRRMEKVFETAQANERKEKECSEEHLNNFSQGAERAATVELSTKEKGGENEHSDISSTEAEETATWEFAAEVEEELEQTLRLGQEEEGKENEHSLECLNIFS